MGLFCDFFMGMQVCAGFGGFVQVLVRFGMGARMGVGLTGG